MPTKSKGFPNFGDSLERAVGGLSPAAQVYKKNTQAGSHKTGVPESAGTGVDLGEKEVAPASTTGTKWEIYKKQSYILITQDDIYELPPGWDDTETGPTWDTGLPDPLDPWFRQARIHEIGYITDTNEIIVEKFNIPLETAGTEPFSQTVEVVVSERNENGPPEGQIPNDLLSSSDAQEAIAQARSEVTG